MAATKDMATVNKHRRGRKDYEQKNGGLKLAGHVITWSAGEGEKTFAFVRATMKDNGLDEGLLRERQAAHAFSRACRKLSEARIIRELRRDKDSIWFQFTKESQEKDRWEYSYEATLKLNKTTGKVECEDSDQLAEAAQKHLDYYMDAVTVSDVTAIVQKLFDREADMFTIRDQGGAYFVPIAYADFLGRVNAFLSALGGHMNRFPVPSGTVEGDAAVKESVTDGMERTIADYRDAVASFGVTTHQKTLGQAAEKIKLLRSKLDVYAVYLAEGKEKLDEALTEAADQLKARIAQITEAKESDLSGMTECDHCGSPQPVDLPGDSGSAVIHCKYCGKDFDIEW